MEDECADDRQESKKLPTNEQNYANIYLEQLH